MNTANPHLPYGPKVFVERLSLRDDRTGERVFAHRRWFLLWTPHKESVVIQKANGKRIGISFQSLIEAENYALHLMKEEV